MTTLTPATPVLAEEKPPTGFLLSFLRSRPDLKASVRPLLERLGFGTTDWVREVMYERCFAFLEGLGPERLDALEIAAGPQWRRRLKFRSYTETQYPDFDICRDVMDQRFDVIIADQVFEHLEWPYRAARHVYAMLKPGGVFVIATPFLVRVHKVPIDCSRWTETGLSHLLQEAGFPAEGIETDSWGNRSCLKSNLTTWRKRGFGSRRNEPNYPVMVWAFARKPLDAPEPTS